MHTAIYGTYTGILMYTSFFLTTRCLYTANDNCFNQVCLCCHFRVHGSVPATVDELP